MNWKTILRDTLLVWGLSLVGGFIVGFSFAMRGAAGDQTEMMLIALSNIICSIIGFTISGCLARKNRFQHLFWVALMTWLTSLFNVVVMGFPFGQWALSIILIMVLMGAGGGLSFIFVRPPPEEE